MIPVNEPKFGPREKELLLQCIDTGWISSDGPFVREFEEKFAGYLGMKHGIAVCNGTASIEAALYALGIQEGDEVIMPTFTIISCAVAALRLGAKPVLVDIDPELWTMDVGQVEKRITPKTRAIMPVHIYGHPVDMDPLIAIAKKYGIPIVEDAAEVHGAEYKGRKCGSMGEVSSFSFYANKVVTTGEGGMVVTNDAAIAERARSYRNLCFIPEKRFLHHELGYNFRMTNLQAAIGVAQTERIEESVAFKRKMGEYYRRKLSAIPGLRFQSEKPWAKSVYWMYSVEIDPGTGLTAEDVMKKLGAKKIGTRPFFLGMHEQPVFHKMGLFAGEKYPHAERAARQGFYLPSGFTLTEAQVDTVCEELHHIMTGK
jgi:perosamine synthetase